MKRWLLSATCGVSLFLLTGLPWAASSSAAPYGRWERGPGREAGFFPIAVWLQSPAKAERYRAAGFNLYVGLWRGPTEEQLETLRRARMPVICHQNAVGRTHLDDPIIVGWMHGDEPDNAQSLGRGQGYGPPIAPERIVADYERIRAVDPNRPVLLNLGQGVAWDGWHGRGVRTNHPEDYPLYVRGCDIASFDIYPVTHRKPEVAGKLWYVARGVERLRRWAGPERVVWNCIECTRISHPDAKPTPQQVRCEVWMSIVHGSMGLIYFVHEWQPRFNESALLSDPEMLAAVTRINAQIRRLAPVLNAPTLPDAVRVASDNAEVPIAAMAKRHDDDLHIFAVAMRPGRTRVRFHLNEGDIGRSAEVLDEQRSVPVRDGTFEDRFDSWDVHMYRVAAR
jgi:hypothetical protein